MNYQGYSYFFNFIYSDSLNELLQPVFDKRKQAKETFNLELGNTVIPVEPGLTY